MKKIAYTLFFLIVFGIIFYSFVFSDHSKFQQDKHENLTEQEQYCLFKGGELGEKDGIKTCIYDEQERNTEDFFYNSMRESDEERKILIKS